MRTLGYPITNTLMGLGAYPASDKQFLGMLGMHGTYEANMAMHELRRHDQHRRALRRPHHRQGWTPSRRTRRKIHVDIDPSSINKNVEVDLPIIGDAAYVLEDMIKVWKDEATAAIDKRRWAWWRRSTSGAAATA